MHLPSNSGLSDAPAPSQRGCILPCLADNYVYALYTADGSLRWQYATTGPVRGSAGLSTDGYTGIGSEDGYFYVFYTGSGAYQFAHPVGSPIRSKPVMDTAVSGDIIFGALDGDVYWLSANGILRAQYATTGPVWSSPALTTDGDIVVGAYTASS